MAVPPTVTAKLVGVLDGRRILELEQVEVLSKRKLYFCFIEGK